MVRDDIIRRRLMAEKPEPSPDFTKMIGEALTHLPTRRRAQKSGMLPVSAIVFVAVAAACIILVYNNTIGNLFPNSAPQNSLQFAAGGETAASGPAATLPGTPAPERTPAGETSADATLSPGESAAPVKTAMPTGLEVIGECSTKISNNANEYKANVRVACSQIDGLLLLPGQKLSFLDVISVKDTRYTSTPINPSEPSQGIRQVASTLYDAALLAGLDIVEWHHGTLMAVYVKKGLEADVNPDKNIDLVVKNNRTNPIWITAKADTDNKIIVVTIYGEAWQGKRPQELASDSKMTQPAPDQMKLVEDPNVAKGDTVTIPARPGYQVTVTRKWFNPNTNETSDETLYEAVYPAIAGEIHYSPGEKPEPTPSPAQTTATPDLSQPISTTRPDITKRMDEYVAKFLNGEVDLSKMKETHPMSNGSIAYGDKAYVEAVYKNADAIIYEVIVSDDKTGSMQKYFENSAGKDGNTEGRVLLKKEQGTGLLLFCLCDGLVDKDYIGSIISEENFNVAVAANDEIPGKLYIWGIYAVLEPFETGKFRIYVVDTSPGYRPESGFTILSRYYSNTMDGGHKLEGTYVLLVND